MKDSSLSNVSADFILVIPTEHGLWPVFDNKAHPVGLAGCLDDQISTGGKAGGFNRF